MGWSHSLGDLLAIIPHETVVNCYILSLVMLSDSARLIVITRGIGLIALCTVLLYNTFKFNVIFHCCSIVDGHIIEGYQTVLEPLAH